MSGPSRSRRRRGNLRRDLYSARRLREKMTGWLLVQSFQMRASGQRRESVPPSATTRIARSGRTRSVVSATCFFATANAPGHAALSRQRRECQGSHQRELRARDHGTAHHGCRLRLYPGRRAGTRAHPHRGRGQFSAYRTPKPGPLLQPDHYPQRACSSSIPARHDYSNQALPRSCHRGYAVLPRSKRRSTSLPREPATATHISRQIATYFLSDNPPEALVQRMAQAFQKSDGDIANVLQTMFRSPEFASAPRSKLKDPMQFVLSAVRLAYDARLSQHRPDPGLASGALPKRTLRARHAGRLSHGLGRMDGAGADCLALRELPARSARMPPASSRCRHRTAPIVRRFRRSRTRFTSIRCSRCVEPRNTRGTRSGGLAAGRDGTVLSLSSPEFMR